jgi:hypothetical protein
MTAQEISQAQKLLADLRKSDDPYVRLRLAKEVRAIVERLPDASSNGTSSGPPHASEISPSRD